MKKIFFLLLLVLGSFGFSMAQTTVTPKKGQATAVAPSSPTASSVSKAKYHPRKTAANKKAKEAVAPGSTTSHLKADGTPDKRYKENKVKKTHLKKDGTPDKRFKENKSPEKS